MKEIARRYAQTLFDLAKQENALEAIHVAFQGLGQILKNKEEFRIFIHNPLLSIEERSSILKHIFDNRIPPLLYKFLLFINLKNRLNILGNIFESFDQLCLEEHNQVRALLETAFDLEESQKENMRQRLGQRYHKKILLDTHLKQELLGGFRFLVQGILYDSSIKSQLEEFRQKVLA